MITFHKDVDQSHINNAVTQSDIATNPSPNQPLNCHKKMIIERIVAGIRLHSMPHMCDIGVNDPKRKSSRFLSVQSFAISIIMCIFPDSPLSLRGYHGISTVQHTFVLCTVCPKALGKEGRWAALLPEVRGTGAALRRHETREA